jgi:hypothetical protein
MDFLLSHWHCVLPIVILIAASFLLNGDKPAKRDR